MLLCKAFVQGSVLNEKCCGKLCVHSKIWEMLWNTIPREGRWQSHGAANTALGLSWASPVHQCQVHLMFNGPPSQKNAVSLTWKRAFLNFQCFELFVFGLLATCVSCARWPFHVHHSLFWEDFFLKKYFIQFHEQCILNH